MHASNHPMPPPPHVNDSISRAVDARNGAPAVPEHHAKPQNLSSTNAAAITSVSVHTHDPVCCRYLVRRVAVPEVHGRARHAYRSAKLASCSKGSERALANDGVSAPRVRARAPAAAAARLMDSGPTHMQCPVSADL